MTWLNRIKYGLGLWEPEPELIEDTKVKMAAHIAKFTPEDRSEIVIHLIYSTLENLSEEKENHKMEIQHREKAISEILKHTNK